LDAVISHLGELTLRANNFPGILDISDKSKSTLSTKGVTLFQLAWFSVNLISRLLDGMSVSLIEVETLSHIFLSTLAFIAWFEKPHDVNKAVVITLDDNTFERMKDFNFQMDTAVHDGRWYIGLADSDPLLFSVILLTFCGVAGIHIAAWHYAFPSFAESWIWRS
jgi:hypothetical protein